MAKSTTKMGGSMAVGLTAWVQNSGAPLSVVSTPEIPSQPESDSVREWGTVEWFNSNATKQFGFIRPDKSGPNVWFHANEGVMPHAGKNGLPKLDSVKDISRPRPYSPSQGERILFIRTTAGKGPKARLWCRGRDYDVALDASQHILSLAEAGRYLATMDCSVLEYVHRMEGTEMTIITMMWSQPGAEAAEAIVARGEFKSTKRSYRPGLEMEGSIVIFPSDPRHKKTVFKDKSAWDFRQSARPSHLQKGEYVYVGWAGGGDRYVVDPTTVRELTADEAGLDVYPTAGNDWLKCSFAPEYGGKNQAVKIICHLSGHD